MRAVAEALIAVMPDRARVGAGRLRGLAYGLGSEALGRRVRDVRQRLRRRR